MLKGKLRGQIDSNKHLVQALSMEELEFIVVPINLLNKDTSEKHRIIILPPVFLGENEQEIFKRLALLYEYGFRRMMVHTLGHISLARDMGFIAHGSFRLNITNSLALSEYEKLGLYDSVLSIELTAARAKKIKGKIQRGLFVYGKIPVMVTRRCPITNGSLCGKGGCDNFLIDRKNATLTLSCDTAVEIMNPDTLVLSDKMEKIADFDFFLMNFTGDEDIKNIVTDYLLGNPPTGKFTRGLYFRGVT